MSLATRNLDHCKFAQALNLARHVIHYALRISMACWSLGSLVTSLALGMPSPDKNLTFLGETHSVVVSALKLYYLVRSDKFNLRELLLGKISIACQLLIS